MDLLDRPLYTMSGPDLNELLQLIEVLVQPLSNLKEVRYCVCFRCGIVRDFWFAFLFFFSGARGGVLRDPINVLCRPDKFDMQGVLCTVQ